MSHNLHIRDGKASMMYVGEVPWHKLGTKLDKPATAEEAIEAAQLDYPVEKRPLRAILKGRQTVDVQNNFANVRMDTGDVLGVVGSRYEIIPNRTAFSFFDGLVDRDEAIYHTAGVLGKGECAWILAKLPGYIRVGKNDPVEKYVLLTNSYSGVTSLSARLSNVRVVCQNTLTVALSGAEQSVHVRHTESAEQRLASAHKLLGLYNSLYSQLEFIFNRMALSRMTDRQLLDYVKKLIPENEDAESSTRTDNIRDTILQLHASGKGANLSRGSLWGAFNAVAEYTDHVQSSHNAQKQLKSMWFGSGERMKKQAFQLALTML